MHHSLSPLSATRGHLVRQLVYFDERLPAFSKTYLAEFNLVEKKLIEDLIREYMEQLSAALEHDDSILGSRLKSDILIGSTVKVTYDDDGSTDSFTLVYPTESDPDRNRISFISPIGRQLLCKKTEHPLVLDVPDGRLGLIIKEVNYGYIGGFVSS